eukprot:7047579-Alexandrium_andersonii.AAC.1
MPAPAKTLVPCGGTVGPALLLPWRCRGWAAASAGAAWSAMLHRPAAGPHEWGAQPSICRGGRMAQMTSGKCWGERAL